MGINYLRKIDTFGVPIELCFEKKKMHKTSWGGFWTLIIFLFSLSVFIILGLEIAYRYKPNLIPIEQLERNNISNFNQINSQADQNNDTFTKDAERATYSSSGIILALAALDGEFQLIQNFYDSFVITGYIIDQRGFKVISKNQVIRFDLCSKLDTFTQPNNQKLFSDFDLSHLICLVNDKSLDHYFTGELGSEIYNYIQIEVKYKVPVNEEIKKVLSYVGVFFTDQMMDAQNYYDPLNKYRKNIILKVSSNNQQEILIRNQHAQIMTDGGLIWSDYNTQSFFYLKDYRINIDKSEQNTLLIIKTETDPKLLVYYRNYMKLTDLLATMGGFIKALLIAGFLLANPVSKLSLKTELINRLFNFEGIEEEEDKSQNKNDKQIPEQEEYRMSKGFSKVDLSNTINNVPQNEQGELAPSQITLNFMRNTSTRNNTQPMNQNNNKTTNITRNKAQYINRNSKKEGGAIGYNESLNSSMAQPILATNQILATYQSNIQQGEGQQRNNLSQIQKNISQQPHLNQLNLLKIARRKNQSMNDLSSMGLPQMYSKKSLSPLVSQQNYQSKQKDKVKLVRTMLKSFVSQHSMKAEDCMKASTILGTHHKKEDPDVVFKKLFKSNEKTLTMKLWDYLKYFLGLKKEVKNKQINFSMRKVNERLDIVFIMKKLIEVDKLKMLFLNENQRKIFEYLPRPIVRLDPDSQSSEQEKYTLNQAWARQMFFNDKNYISKASEAMLAYQNIIQKGSNSLDQLDQKLIDMLDESKKQFFQVDSPIVSPTLKQKRNSLSVIKSILHSPSKQKNQMFLQGLQNISPAESIELNEYDLQEINNYNNNNNNNNGVILSNDIELQHPNNLIQKYDNKRCFNKKNTMHFMRQRPLQIVNIPTEQFHKVSQQQIPQDIQQQFSQNKQSKGISNNQSQDVINKQIDQTDIDQSINHNSFSFDQQQHFKQQQQQQQCKQSNSQIQGINAENDQIEQIGNIQDEMKDINNINVPMNTVKTPTCKIFSQFFSPQNPQNGSASPFKNKENKENMRKQMSEEQLESFRSRDEEINNDYQKCPSPAEEGVKQNNFIDNPIHSNPYQIHNKPSNNKANYICKNNSNENGGNLIGNNNENNETLQKLESDLDQQPNIKVNGDANQAIQSKQKIQDTQYDRNIQIDQHNRDCLEKQNQQIEMDNLKIIANSKVNSLLNLSMEPLQIYSSGTLKNTMKDDDC